MPKFSSLSRSVAWVSLSLVVTQGLRLLQGVIVARWLGPTEMGLYAYVYSILTLIDLLRSIGAEQIYIARSPADDVAAEKDWLAACWNVRLALACLVGLLMFLGGVTVSTIVGDQRLGVLLMLMSFMSPLIASRSARLIHQQKVQHFASLSKFEMAAALLQTLIPLAVVYFHHSVEWLVAANIAAGAIASIISHVVFPMQFKFDLPAEARKELWFYGRNNIATSLLTTLHTNLDNFAVGSFIGRATLGIYSTGYRLAMSPYGFMQPIAQRILMPHYRRANDVSLSELADQWRVVFRFQTLAYTILLSGIILSADWIVDTLFGAKWERMEFVLVFSCFIGYCRGLTVTISPLLIVLRAPHLDARFKFLEVSAFCAFVTAGAFERRIDLLLLGGALTYLLAFWFRWQWWGRTLDRVKLRNAAIRELIYPLLGLGSLSGAAILRSLHLNSLIVTAAFCAVLAGLTLITGIKLKRQFSRFAA